MKIGIIKYRKYDEWVLLGQHFIIDDLINIILNDADYVKFQIVDGKENVLLSTHYPDTGNAVEYIEVLKVKREVEILSTTYNAYKTPSLVHKTKVTWITAHGGFKTKKKAQKYADTINHTARFSIEKFITQNDDRKTHIVKTTGIKITDTKGCEIQVTDLEKAIEQADDFKNRHHIPPIPSDKEQQAYWKDIYEKLLKLKSKISR